MFFFLMTRRPPRTTRTDTLFPYTTLFRSVASNKDYLTKILAHEAFASGDFNTGFVVRHFPQQRIANETHSFRQIALAAVALYLDDARALVDANGLLPEFVGWASRSQARRVGKECVSTVRIRCAPYT